jgi:hypothetical protein
MILLTKSPGSSKSFQEAPRKVQKISGQKYRNNSVGFLEEVLTPKGHLKLTDLYDSQYASPLARNRRPLP